MAETDCLNYEMLRDSYGWMRHRDQRMVISTDLDGYLSGIMLRHFLGWEVVGLYDLASLWLLPAHRTAISDLIFVDLDIAQQGVRSIGHHILDFSPHVRFPGQRDETLNPNILRDVTVTGGFQRKYPFGTVHLALACLLAWGDVSEYTVPAEALPFLLHADSSLQNAFTYQHNAIDWLNWLGGSQPSSPLYPFCQALHRLRPQNLLGTAEFYDRTLTDCGIKISKYKAGRAQVSGLDFRVQRDRDSVRCIVQKTANAANWQRGSDLVDKVCNAFACGEMVEHRLARTATSVTAAEFAQVLKRTGLFSYAFVYGKNNPKGLNYSVWP